MSQPLSVEWLQTPHGRIAWAEDGPDVAVPLVLLQRFRGTMDDWDPEFIAHVSCGRRVIRFDSAGIGRSGGRVPDGVAGIAAVAADVIRALGLRKVDVLGWSLGGCVALQLALDAPQLVRRLIVAGSSPGGIKDGPEPHPLVAEVMTRGSNDEADFLFLFYPDTPTARASGHASLRRIAGQRERGPLVSAEAVAGQLRAIATWPGVLDRAGELQLPMLVANGLHDVMLPAYRSYVLAQTAPNAKLVLYPDAGHAFLFHDIEDVAAEIDWFLA